MSKEFEVLFFDPGPNSFALARRRHGSTDGQLRLAKITLIDTARVGDCAPKEPSAMSWRRPWSGSRSRFIDTIGAPNSCLFSKAASGATNESRRICALNTSASRKLLTFPLQISSTARSYLPRLRRNLRLHSGFSHDWAKV